MSEIINVFEKRNIRMIRGDTLKFTVTFDGLTESLSSAGFTVRDISTDTIVFTKILNSWITQNQDGSYTVRVAPADTASASIGKYIYDFQIGIGSDIYTLLTGLLFIDQDVTR